jgi:glycosyltransferase involved in cell wall biosynthesis
VLDEITPLILTYNEAPNIERTLNKLLWARPIIVIDSGSTDETLKILQRYPQVDVLHHPFRDFAIQWNFGLDQIASPWVLSLDADYELSDAFVSELRSLMPSESKAGYTARFVYRINGKALRGSLYPPRTVLFRREKARYRLDGHTQRLVVEGDVGSLSSVIYHDDRKPLSRWLVSQLRYARDEAEYLLRHDARDIGLADRLRLMAWPAPIAVLFYTLFVKGCLFDGWCGWLYALQRLIAEALLALELAERRLRGADVLEGRPADETERPSPQMTGTEPTV